VLGHNMLRGGELSERVKNLVFAARLEDGHDHEIRVRVQPFLRSRARLFRHARKRPEVFVPREATEVLAADAGEAGNFFLGEDLLAGLDSHHVVASQSVGC
jgi:hypothetical protein